MLNQSNSSKTPSLSQPPTLTREKGFELVKKLIANGQEDIARDIDKKQDIGYFEELEQLKCAKHDWWLDKFITQDESMLKMKHKIRQLVSVEDNVLVCGESGTGKELIAQALHGNKHPDLFLDINCAGLPEHLIEAELFGYVEGAFTGARKGGYEGLLLAAGKGTVFLDEIGELGLVLQAKLLRVIQTRKIRRVGSDKNEELSCRFIFATHQRIRENALSGLFRNDLYWRISTITLETLPLRDRLDDIPLIIAKLDESYGTFPSDFPWDKYMAKNSLAGNVRELEQIVRRYQLFKELPQV